MASVGASLFSNRPSLGWEYAALTDVGRTRAHNEDDLKVDPALGLAVLADGMGGYKGGEVASAMAVTMVHASFARWYAQAGSQAPARVIRRALQAATDEANAAIFEAGMTNAEVQGMGTTLVLAAFGPKRVLVGHIGDSRCYRLRDKKLEQLTRDHSLLQEQLDSGAITAEQAAQSPHRNLVTRALGIERHVDLEMHEHNVRPDDLYLLCSDGLSEMVSDAQIFTVLLQETGLSEKATLLVALANENGGRDNISVVLARANSQELAA